MQSIVDLHIHSHYSRATSKHTTLEWLYYWAKVKGITIVGTGDFTHPKWLAEIQEKLELGQDGYYHLRPDIASSIDATLPTSVRGNPLVFVLTVEISNIYKRLGKVRRLHNCIVYSSIEKALKLNEKLTQIGNLRSDGRPILGLDSRDLLEMTLDVDQDSLFFPAHIWTPWFAMFGSRSGFDSIEEAFGDLAQEIKVVETGLSSDPFMNWRISELENRTIISNSDAHSPQKLGREATVFENIASYKELINTLKTNGKKLIGTIEFYPQEGKYHYDGHRACGICWSPEQTKKHEGICPVCGHMVVVGVENRVDSLASRPLSNKSPHKKTIEYIIPLAELISQVMGGGVASKKNTAYYFKLISDTADEFTLLRTYPISQFEKAGHSQIGRAIEAMKANRIRVQPGYDGEFGKINVILDVKKDDPSQIQLL